MRCVVITLCIPLLILPYQHHLCYTSKTEIISTEDITGKCYIQYLSAIGNLEAWLHQKNHFYIQDNFNKPLLTGGGDEIQMLDSSTHSYCEECYREHVKTLEREDILYEQNKPLQALEIFSGLFSIPIK